MAMAQTSTLRNRHPELFAVDKLIDPRSRHRVVDMEVLALGMSRTGTASMQAALQILGYNPTYHGFSMFYNIRDVDMWTDGLHAKFFPQETDISPFEKEDFDQLLGEYRAVCDMPSITFAVELMTAYPNAKIVLVERDIEAWYKSFDEAVIKNSFNPVARFISSLDTEYLARLDKMLRIQLRGQFRSTSKKQLMDNARPIYREHYNTIRKMAPSEQLLNFQLKDGWEPLCKFLEKPVPDCSFPRMNESSIMEEKIQIVVKMAAVRALKGWLQGGFALLVQIFKIFSGIIILEWIRSRRSSSQ